MDLKITPDVVAGFRDKDSKVPEYRTLYEERPFLAAYAEHTNMRMAKDPHGAIGRADEWEGHGRLQLNFLKAQGLKPSDRVLDIGCGPGRAARRLVPYLDVGHYTGVDISAACIEHAQQLAVAEGWSSRQPIFVHAPDGIGAFTATARSLQVDVAWAHSVFTHLPPDEIRDSIEAIARILAPGGRFFFTYKQAPKIQRSGLKQFQYPLEFFDHCARNLGGSCVAEPTVWPAHQLTGVISGLRPAR